MSWLKLVSMRAWPGLGRKRDERARKQSKTREERVVLAFGVVCCAIGTRVISCLKARGGASLSVRVEASTTEARTASGSFKFAAGRPQPSLRLLLRAALTVMAASR
ncbi:hypothetical protein BFW01_g8984 [Lasiodiplodia theobromae]|nr:hypothetical protein BFW01_g8984 [Lasiodiplodia theobromae]